MNLYIEDLPPKLFCMILSVWYVFFSLLYVSNDSLTEVVLFSKLMQFFKSWFDLRCLRFDLFQKISDSIVANILANYELILSNLFVGVIVVILLAKVDSHTSKEFSWKRTYLLI